MRKTSKNFNEEEIISITREGEVYLKEGVTRMNYNNKTDNSYINNILIIREKIEKFISEHGIEDHNNDCY